MSRISGGAVWSNCPRTVLARAPAEKLAGATLLYAYFGLSHTKKGCMGYLSHT